MLACFLLCLLVCADGQLSLAALPFASHLGLESGVRRLRFCLGHGTRTRTAETGGAKLRIAATVPALFFSIFILFFTISLLSCLLDSGVGPYPFLFPFAPFPFPHSHSVFIFYPFDQVLFSFFSFLFFSFC